MGSKIPEILNSMEKFSYSFEVTPDVTEEQLNKITLEPAFYSITWHAKLYKFDNLDIAPLRLAEILANKNKNVLLHISCHKLRKKYLYSVLTFLKSNGICNLFVVLGEGYEENQSDYRTTPDLINSIREHSGDYFSIGVAGHCTREGTIESLQSKIKSGANFILTQAFFDANVFKSFIIKCKDAGISVPIIPGVFSFETESEMTHCINLCKVDVDANLMEILKKQPSKDIVKNMVNMIYTEMDIKHFHFFTVNKLERAENIIKEIVNP